MKPTDSLDLENIDFKEKAIETGVSFTAIMVALIAHDLSGKLGKHFFNENLPALQIQQAGGLAPYLLVLVKDFSAPALIAAVFVIVALILLNNYRVEE